MIVAVMKTLNAEPKLGALCRAYATIADKVLVLDAGSIDRTVEIISQFGTKFEVKVEYPRIEDKNYTNELIDWAKSQEPRWIVYDWLNGVPNYILRDRSKLIFKDRANKSVFVRRVRAWMNDQVAIEANFKLWAWRPGLMNIMSLTDIGRPILSPIPAVTEMSGRLNLDFPACVLTEKEAVTELAEYEVLTRPGFAKP